MRGITRTLNMPSYTQSSSHLHPYSYASAVSAKPRQRSIPTIKTTPPPAPETLPIPYVCPQPPAKKLRSYPAPLLPSRPEPALWHPRHELQRRPSPTGPMFDRDTIAPPAAALAVQPPLSASQRRSSSTYQRPRTEGKEECVYVLTLKTSADIAGRMGGLREKWFPKHRNKVPAHITLFHALPASKYDEVTLHLHRITARTRSFPIASGKVVKRRSGVAINMGVGEKNVRDIFKEAKEEWDGFLSNQDRGFTAHWTVQNKEDDKRRVDEAFEDVQKVAVNGMAVGLVLWKYERDGRWSFAKDFDFRSDDEVRKDSGVVDEDTGRNQQ